MAKKTKGFVPRDGAQPATETVSAAAPAAAINADPKSDPAAVVPAELVKADTGRKVKHAVASADKEPADKMAVSDAELHTEIRFAGQLEKRLGRIADLQMLWVRGEGLLIRKGDSEALIPSPAIKIVHFKKRS